MILRRAVFILALISLVLAVVLAHKKRQNEIRMEKAKQELFTKRDEQSPLFESLLRNHRKYFDLKESERRQARKIYKQIKKDPERTILAKTLEQYDQWLQSQSLFVRMNHLSHSSETKIEEIRQSLHNQQEESPSSFDAWLVRMRWALPPELRYTNLVPFLDLYKTWINQKYNQCISQISDKKMLEHQRKMLSLFFGDKSDIPGLWTQSSLLRLHSENTDFYFEEFLDEVPMDHFRELMSDDAWMAFDQMNFWQQRFFIGAIIRFALTQDFRKTDYVKNYHAGSFTSEQEKLLGEIFEILPQRDQETIMQLPAREFTWEVVSRLLLPGSVVDIAGGVEVE